MISRVEFSKHAFFNSLLPKIESRMTSTQIGEARRLVRSFKPIKEPETAAPDKIQQPSANAEAQYNLGVCYGNGDGVASNYVEAHKWINLTAAKGNEDSKQTLPVVERRMTSGQIAEARRLAREFKPRKPVQQGGFVSR